MNLYLSIDVETTGPIPGPNSMISLGAAMFDETGKLLGTFSVNLKELPGSFYAPDTLAFWNKNQDAWRAALLDAKDPAVAIYEFYQWVRAHANADGIKGVIPVCYPAAFDYMFVYWYLKNFIGECHPFTFSCIDLKSFASATYNLPYYKVNKKKLPKADTPHTHIAVEDAIGQGEIFFKVLGDNYVLHALQIR